MKSKKHPPRVHPSGEEEIPESEEKLVEALARLSAETISELIEEEPDNYTIKVVKVKKSVLKICPDPDLNRGQPDLQSGALPN